MSRVAVVILNYNGEKLLKQFLPSVITNTVEADIWVADNGSVDASVSLLERDFPSVKRILLPQNFGFCGGYNRALKQIEAQYYVLLNSDVQVTPEWLAPLLTLMDGNAHIGAVQPKILSYNKPEYFEYAGAAGGFIDSFGYPFCRGRLFDNVEEDHNQYDDTRPAFWASGACLMMRAELFHRFGGFDEDFFAHMEEIDLCWKLQRGGFSVYYCGQSTVYHLGAGTLGYESPRKTFLNFRNSLIMLFKHYTPSELFTRIPVRIALDWLAAGMFLIKGKPRLTGSVFRAHLSLLRTMRSTWRKRRAIRSAHPNYPQDQIYRGLALMHFVIGGRRALNVPNNPK